MHRLTITTLILAAVAAGCNNTSMDDARLQARGRWQLARARMLYGLAEEQLKGGKLDEAYRKAREAVAIQPEFHDARLVLAKVYIEQGRYPLAIRELEQLAVASPEEPEYRYLLGVAQEKHGDLTAALESYRRAQALGDDDRSAVMAIGEVLVAMNRIDEARAFVISHLALAGDDAGLYELAGRLAMMQEDYRAAASHYRQACDIDYENIRYRELLAKAQFRGEQYRDALDTLEALADNRRYEGGAWFYGMLGDAYMHVGRIRQACRAYFEATELSPNVSAVWAKLARAAMTAGERERAVLAAQQAQMLDPADPGAVILLGYALLKDERVDGALRVLADGVAAHPEDATLRCLLGRAFAAAGRDDMAVTCYNAALDVDPSHPLARDLLRDAGHGQALSQLN